MSNRITVIIEKTNTGYCAHSDILQGCAATSDTIEEIKTEYKEAAEMHLEFMRLNGRKIPLVFMGDYVFKFNYGYKYQ